jgi:hypothetical protein
MTFTYFEAVWGRSINRKRFKSLVTFLLLSSIVLISLSVRIQADMPEIRQIENVSQDSTGKIKVQIRHDRSLDTNMSIHYVDKIQIEVDGNIKQFYPCECKQESKFFIVELPLGDIQEHSEVKARVHCTIHGWSAWSDHVQISEFSSKVIITIIILVCSIFVLKKIRKK